MNTSLRGVLKSWVSLAAAGVLAVAASAALKGVHAQNDDETAAPAAGTAYAEFQSATLSGANNTINVTMLPVILGNGDVVYKNLALQVNVNPTTGAITVAGGYPKVTAAPTTLISGFKAGDYVGPGGKSSQATQLLTLIGPGVASGGATEWSTTTSPGATGCTYPTTATFYDGPISRSPWSARLKAAGITLSNYSYGVMGNQTCSGGGNWWDAGALLGFSQTGNALTIVSFTYAADEDQSTPGAQITFTYE